MTTAKSQTQARQVAATILDQLGARRFMMMTGARESGLYAQDLQRAFTRLTGLDTHL